MQNTPSGIAQLRKSSENTVSVTDPMNIDDFIFSENAATPAGIASPLPPAASHSSSRSQDHRSSHALTSAIPIKSRKDLAQQQQQQQEQHSQFVPQSVPVQAHQQNHQGNEFHYVQRHLRKTSIDERRVSRKSLEFISYCTTSIFMRHFSMLEASVSLTRAPPTTSIWSAAPPRTLELAHLPSQ
jgi:GATA-binding protein